MAPGVSRAPCAEARCPSPRVGNAANATSLRVVSPSRFGSRQRACDPSFRRLTPSERAGVRGLRRLWFERREHCKNTARTLREHCKNTARLYGRTRRAQRSGSQTTTVLQATTSVKTSHDISQDKPRHQSRQATTSADTDGPPESHLLISVPIQLPRSPATPSPSHSLTILVPEQHHLRP
jgi:hypothetical protein